MAEDCPLVMSDETKQALAELPEPAKKELALFIERAVHIWRWGRGAHPQAYRALIHHLLVNG
jgi:hypothetical protein